MGIKLLNSLIKTKCLHSNMLISLSSLKNKKIVIDISIYLYRFKSINKLVENMYLMCGILWYHQIKPIFIFDGIPPPQKKNELFLRQQQKKEAKKLYNVLNRLPLNKTKRTKLKQLQRIFTRINKKDIENAKKIIQLYGFVWKVAKGEADVLCAQLVISEQAYACLSEDTDLFVYGCPIVLRYFSLRRHSVVLYNLDKILKELKLNIKQFREMCVISGTDYNVGNHNIYYYYDIYKCGGCFSLTAEEKQIYDIFVLSVIKPLVIKPSAIDKKELMKFMEQYNFIMPPPY